MLMTGIFSLSQQAMDMAGSGTVAPNHISYMAHPETSNVTGESNITVPPPRLRDASLLRVEIAVQAAIFCLAVLGKPLHFSISTYVYCKIDSLL